jgi:hypothetical protein
MLKCIGFSKLWYQYHQKIDRHAIYFHNFVFLCKIYDDNKNRFVLLRYLSPKSVLLPYLNKQSILFGKIKDESCQTEKSKL